MFGKKKTEEAKKEEQKYTWQQNVALYPVSYTHLTLPTTPYV